MKVEQTIQMHNSQYIVLPKWKGGESNVSPNLAIPDVYVLNTKQVYPVGAQFVDSDRIFHYGFVSTVEGTTTKCGQGLCNIAEEATPVTSDVVEPIGETEISIVDTTSTLNQWAGGYLMSRSHPTYTYRILSNTATAGSVVVVTLERGLIAATTAGQTVRLNQNPFSNLCSTVNAGREYVSFMGTTPVVPVAGTWQWVQGWGPANVLGGDEVPGSGDYLRMGQFNIDGTLVWGGWANAASGLQFAGYLLSSSGAPTHTPSWFMYLMVAR